MMRPIRYLGDPVLRGKTENVKSINQDIKLLVQSMFASMQKANGVGLAAPQVGVNLAIAVIDIPGHLPFAIINPKITKSSGTPDSLIIFLNFVIWCSPSYILIKSLFTLL